jgi:hypothetical protein
MALLGALCLQLNTVIGFTNRSLRAQVSQLLGASYTPSQMGYDLGRLRLNGLMIERLDSSNTYVLTSEGSLSPLQALGLDRRPAGRLGYNGSRSSTASSTSGYSGRCSPRTQSGPGPSVSVTADFGVRRR